MNQSELCQLIYDLQMTAQIEVSSAAKGEVIDPIKLTTACMHMLYLMYQDQPAVPILFTTAWTDSPEDVESRLIAVLNALMYLGSQQTFTAMSLESPTKWLETATLAVNELLYNLLGQPTLFKDYIANIAMLIKMLGFKPETNRAVFYKVMNLDSRREEYYGLPYHYRTH